MVDYYYFFPSFSLAVVCPRSVLIALSVVAAAAVVVVAFIDDLFTGYDHRERCTALHCPLKVDSGSGVPRSHWTHRATPLLCQQYCCHSSKLIRGHGTEKKK